jgi:hypothetical protein
MIRLIATGVWICLVTALSSYAASMWQMQSTAGQEVDKLFGGLRSMQTSTISVPVVSDGAVQGYVVAQFTFTMNSDVERRMSVKPDVFLLDAAFRAIYGSDPSVLRGARKQDLQELTASIKERSNARFGKPFIEDVLIEKYNFVPKSEARTGASLVKMRPELAR